MKKRVIANLPIAAIVSLFCIVANLPAQAYCQSGYLEGVVPVENGKVVFRKSFSAPGIGVDSLMSLTRQWIEGRDNPDEERSSRVLIADEEKGIVMGGCREKLVFKSALLVLDRADLNYYLQATCTDGAVDLAILRIRYDYGDQRHNAEELITDEVSLNKDRSKILRTSEKWRVKTIDFTRELFRDYGNFLSGRE